MNIFIAIVILVALATLATLAIGLGIAHIAWKLGSAKP